MKDVRKGLDASLIILPHNAVLRTYQEVNRSIALTKSLGLPLHVDPFKNWDSLAAWSIINRYFSRRHDAKILDAGGETYSVILKQLQKAGFRDLTCINLVFKTSVIRKGIRFQYGDITQTDFSKSQFDAITCLSVIEHGVDVNSYFKEMSRILKPGGVLVTSVDYWATPIDTMGQMAYGVPIKIFNRKQVVTMATIALKNKLELMDKLDLKCSNKVVCWKLFNLNYTFLYFTMRKK